MNSPSIENTEQLHARNPQISVERGADNPNIHAHHSPHAAVHYEQLAELQGVLHDKVGEKVTDQDHLHRQLGGETSKSFMFFVYFSSIILVTRITYIKYK